MDVLNEVDVSLSLAPNALLIEHDDGAVTHRHCITQPALGAIFNSCRLPGEA